MLPRFLLRRRPTKFRVVPQRTQEWSPLSSLGWIPSLTYRWNPSPPPRWLLDARRGQYTFHCSLRGLLFVGDDACAHNLLLKWRPFIMRLHQLCFFNSWIPESTALEHPNRLSLCS